MKRLEYLDLVKGIGIICVLFTHTMTDHNVVITWISSWYMPIFFIIGGIIFWYQYKENNRKDNFKSFFTKKLTSIALPYFIFGLIISCFLTVLETIGGDSLRIGEYLFKIISMQGLKSLWFLPCYFFAQIVTYIFIKNNKRIYSILYSIVGGGICVSIIIITYLKYKPDLWIIRLPIKFAAGFAFTWFGYIIGKYKIIEKMKIYYVVVMIALCSYLAIKNGFVSIGGIEFGNGFLFFINAIFLSIPILYLARIFKEKHNCNLLDKFGRNSIVVLCTNDLFIEIIRLIDYKLFGNFLLQTKMLGCVIFTIILIVCEIFMIYISKGKLGILFGKRKKAS